MKKLLVGAALTVATVAGLGAGPVAAGEITGKNTRPMVVGTTTDGHTILHAKSVCAFSGLNDEFVEGDETAPRTQTPAEAAGTGLTGMFCNGSGR